MDNQLITILRITTQQQGSFVKGKFEEHGIEVFFTNEKISLSNQYNPNEVLLKVKAKHSEKAIAILLQLHKEYDLEKIKEDPSIATYKKVLVPVKLSENCIEICKYAIGLAIKQNAEIKLLYTYEYPTFNEPDRHTASWERYVKMELKEAHDKAQLRLVNFSKKLKKEISEDVLQAVNLHYRMLKGSPVDVITEACKRYNPDLILMGTKTKRSKDGEFLSKTVIKVINQTHFPVLAVPVSAKFKGKDVINVMYATNFYDSDNASLNKMLALLEAYNKKIHCVHIELHGDPNHKNKADELNKMLEDKYNEHHIKCVLFESDSIVHGFDRFVAENDIDIITLSKVKHSALYKLFHSDLSAKLVATEKVPILIFSV